MKSLHSLKIRAPISLFERYRINYTNHFGPIRYGLGKRVEKISYNYTSIKRAIETRHKTLIHEMIDNKKAEGYTFGVERRRSKTGKIYDGYLYRQKRNVNGKREHLSLKARDLDDYRNNVLLEQAKREVFQDNLGMRADEGLTRSERKTFYTIAEECIRHRKRDDRNPVVRRYIKQLGLDHTTSTPNYYFHPLNLIYLSTSR